MSVFIIKIGGNVLDAPEVCTSFLKRFAQIKGKKVLVHGGGKIATQMASQLSIETQMVEGRRITDKPMLDVVTMVYGGLVNKNLVAQLQSMHCNGIGLTGADAGIIRSIKRPVKTIDYGFVGDVEEVRSEVLKTFLEAGLVPVIAPLTYSNEGLLLNTNADTMASATAVGLSTDFPTSLIYCFEKKGVLSDPENDESVIPVLNQENYAAYKSAGAINKGMIPKLDNAFNALKLGVEKVIICHAEDLEMAISGNAGTTVIL